MNQIPNLNIGSMSRIPTNVLGSLRSHREQDTEQQLLDLVISKAIYDVQHFYNSNKMSQEENKVFFSQELVLESIRKTCYLQSVLLILNQIKRFVMNTLLSEDAGYKGILKTSIQELFANSRKRLSPSFFPVLSVMEKIKPSQYKGGSKLGDTLECFHDITNTMVDDET